MWPKTVTWKTFYAQLLGRMVREERLATTWPVYRPSAELHELVRELAAVRARPVDDLRSAHTNRSMVPCEGCWMRAGTIASWVDCQFRDRFPGHVPLAFTGRSL